MTEKDMLHSDAEPQAEGFEAESENIEATTPNGKSEEVLIPIKFNKEEKNLTVSEAADLAQKGMKFDVISEDYNSLKELARLDGKSVTEYLESLKAENYLRRKQELTDKCGGDEALAEHIVELEKNQNTTELRGFNELNEAFPEIKSIEQLPTEVVEKAKLKGALLLDEYLRYRLAQKRKLQQSVKAQEKAQRASIGSQMNRKTSLAPETEEFIRGLWK